MPAAADIDRITGTYGNCGDSICGFNLHSDNSEQEKLLDEIKRVLKPGGILYINDFLLNEDERNKARYEAFASRYGTYGVFELPEGAVCRHHDETWILKLLSGFDKLKYKHLTFTTMNGNQSNGFYFIGKRLC